MSGAFADRVIKFDTAWKFDRGNPAGAQASSFADASWQTVYLPHPDSVLLNIATSSYYIGYCWYRKHLLPDASFLGKKVFLKSKRVCRPHWSTSTIRS